MQRYLRFIGLTCPQLKTLLLFFFNLKQKMDGDFFESSQLLNIPKPIDYEKILYNQHDGYWSGTLIRVNKRSANSNDIPCCQLKIYNK